MRLCIHIFDSPGKVIGRSKTFWAYPKDGFIWYPKIFFPNVNVFYHTEIENLTHSFFDMIGRSQTGRNGPDQKMGTVVLANFSTIIMKKP